MFHPGNEQLKPIAKENNARDYSLEQCIEWFSKVEDSWHKESIATGRLYTCVDTCGKCSQ
jgi:hypothetical protein